MNFRKWELFSGSPGTENDIFLPGSYVWKYADPIGAMIISFYIFYNWWKTGARELIFV